VCRGPTRQYAPDAGKGWPISGFDTERPLCAKSCHRRLSFRLAEPLRMQFPKLLMRVQFPSPAPWRRRSESRRPSPRREEKVAGGADALLTKPIDFDALRNRIDSRLASAVIVNCHSIG